MSRASPSSLDALHRLRERPDPGQDQPVGTAHRVGIVVTTASAPTRSSAFSTERRFPIP